MTRQHTLGIFLVCLGTGCMKRIIFLLCLDSCRLEHLRHEKENAFIGKCSWRQALPRLFHLTLNRDEESGMQVKTPDGLGTVKICVCDHPRSSTKFRRFSPYLYSFNDTIAVNLYMYISYRYILAIYLIFSGNRTSTDR